MRRILVRGYNEILKTAGELDGNFFFGLTTGAIILSVILYRFAGMAIGQPYSLDVAFSPMGQFHLVTIDLFFLFMPVSYYLLKDLDRGRRTIATLIMAIFMFSLHDVFWLVETFWVPQIYKDGLIITSIPFEEYIYHFSKNAINIIPCLAFLLKWRVFKPNYLAGLAFAGMILFHIYNIVFQVNIYVLNSSALLVMETIDAIPYLLLLWRKKKEPMFLKVLG